MSQPTPITSPVLTSVFMASDLAELLSKNPDYVIVTSYLEVTNVTGGLGAVMRIKATGKKNVPLPLPNGAGSASEQIEVPGCPVPPCVTNQQIDMQCVSEALAFLQSYNFATTPFIAK